VWRHSRPSLLRRGPRLAGLLPLRDGTPGIGAIVASLEEGEEANGAETLCVLSVHRHAPELISQLCVPRYVAHNEFMRDGRKSRSSSSVEVVPRREPRTIVASSAFRGPTQRRLTSMPPPELPSPARSFFLLLAGCTPLASAGVQYVEPSPQFHNGETLPEVLAAVNHLFKDLAPAGGYASLTAHAVPGRWIDLSVRPSTAWRRSACAQARQPVESASSAQLCPSPSQARWWTRSRPPRSSLLARVLIFARGRATLS